MQIRDVLEIIRKHNGNHDIVIVIDEFHKMFSKHGRNSITKDELESGKNFLQELCMTILDNKSTNDKMILCSLDAFVVNEIATESGRPVHWIPLRGLNETDSKKAIGENSRPLVPTHILYKCLHLANGHPRSIENYYLAIKEYNQTRTNLLKHDDDDDLFLYLTEEAYKKFNFTINVSDKILAASFVGDHISISEKIDGFFVADLVNNTVFIYSTESSYTKDLVPRLAGMHLKHIMSKPKIDDINFWAPLLGIQKYLIRNNGTLSHIQKGLNFEYFHYCFEVLKQVARRKCSDLRFQRRWSLETVGGNDYICCSISEHYSLSVDTDGQMRWLSASPEAKELNQVNNPILFDNKLLWPTRSIDVGGELRKLPNQIGNINEVIDIFNKNHQSVIRHTTDTFPDIDAVIICKKNNSEEVVCLLLEMKFTISDESNVSELKTQISNKLKIQTKYVKNLRANIANCHCVISIFPMWHNLPPELVKYNPWNRLDMTQQDCIPDALLIIGRQQLNDFYVSLIPFEAYSSKDFQYLFF